jgi:hypothetical protein
MRHEAKKPNTLSNNALYESILYVPDPLLPTTTVSFILVALMRIISEVAVTSV